jgi:hypothetical protein
MMMNASEAGKQQRQRPEKLKVAERRLSRVQSMCMKHPEAEFVSFWHGFQVTPKGPVVTMFVQQDQFHAFLRIDVM